MMGRTGTTLPLSTSKVGIARRDRPGEDLDDMKEGGRCHPLLSSKRKRGQRYNHGFSSAQIQILGAICEALIPPIPQDFDFISKENTSDQELAAYIYQASGSEPPLPEEVAELLIKRGLPRAVTLVSLILLILSFRVGTLLLCGVLCLHWKWPFIRSFSEIPLARREVILKIWSWSCQWYLIPPRAFFSIIKQFCFFNFFSRSEENEAAHKRKATADEVDTRNYTTETQEHETLRRELYRLHPQMTLLLTALLMEFLDILY